MESMRWANKHTSLKKVYYRSFVLLIVVPILLIFLASLSITRYMIQKNAVSNIENSQEAIRSSLSESVEKTALQLSHLVFVNNNELLSLAAAANSETTAKRYELISRMDEIFRVAAAPSQNTVSGMFYMKNGQNLYLKDEIRMPKEEIEKEEWYQAALEKPDVISMGIFDTSVYSLTYSRLKRGECVLAAALSPSRLLDRSKTIEMVMLFDVIPIGDLMRRYNKDPMMGLTFLTDSSGKMLFAGESHDRAQNLLTQLNWEELKSGSRKVQKRLKDPVSGRGENYTIVTSPAGYGSWLLITCVQTRKLTEEYNQTAAILIVIASALMFLFYLYSRFFLRSIIVPVHTMVEGLQELEKGNLEIHLQPEGHAEIRTMMHSFNRMVRRLKASILENEQVQQKKHEAEVRALQSQINPHFLVNTLNSIRFMAQVARFDGIRKMAEALIKILSCSFRGNISFYTVKEELEVLDSYIYLMKIRYSDGFEVSYEIDETCLDYRVPRLILQPIVENSIVHGLSEKEEDIGHLIVRVSQNESHLIVVIRDDGRGMSEEEICALLTPKERQAGDNTSIGVENVYSRMKLYFGENCSISMESVLGEFTETTIEIPKILGEQSSEQSPDSR